MDLWSLTSEPWQIEHGKAMGVGEPPTVGREKVYTWGVIWSQNTPFPGPRDKGGREKGERGEL